MHAFKYCILFLPQTEFEGANQFDFFEFYTFHFMECNLVVERSQLEKYDCGCIDFIIISNAICNPLHVAVQPIPISGICTTARRAQDRGASRLFELLLGAELVGVSALLLAAVGGTGRETSL